MNTSELEELQKVFTQKELSAAEHMSDRTAKILGNTISILAMTLATLYLVIQTLKMWSVFPNLWGLHFIKFSLEKLYLYSPRDIEPLLWHFERKVVLKEHLIQAYRLDIDASLMFK